MIFLRFEYSVSSGTEHSNGTDAVGSTFGARARADHELVRAGTIASSYGYIEH